MNNNFNSTLSICITQKQSNLGLDQLSPNQLNQVEAIAQNRSYAGFMAQSILSQYYGYDFSIVLEPNASSLPYQPIAKFDANNSIDSEFTINPNPAQTTINLAYKGILEMQSLYELIVINSEGKELITHILKGEEIYNTAIDITQIPQGVYTIALRKSKAEIAQNKFIKQ